MLWSLIMAGGSGTRFWPESRSRKPKQFLSIFGKKTLVEQTVDRLHPVIPSSRVLVITNQQHVRDAKKILGLPSKQIVGEPVARNTAPCAILAAAFFLKRDPEAVIAILPSDHRIANEKLFRKALAAASKVTQKTGMPVTFGIKPAFANTGYGYLEMGPKFSREAGLNVFRLKRFHEKPNAAKAKKFVQSGRFLWNSGMFVWRADKMMEIAKKYMPEAHDLAFEIVNSGIEKSLNKMYKHMPNISIDYGLMEKMAGNILTLPVDIGWHDLGGWLAFEDFWEKDADGNSVRGRAVLLNSKNNIVKSEKRLVAMIGVEDFVVVDTDDAILVCPKSRSEEIRSIVQALKDRKLEVHL